MEIQVNDITLHYVRVGNGQPLLLLHGNGEDHTIFTDLIALLARHYTVYALDSRDHGQSSHNVPITYQLMADDVLAFTAVLNLQAISLVGFSDGAIVGMLVASQQPTLVHKLVLAGGNLTPAGVKWHSRLGVRLANWHKSNPLLHLMMTEPNISTSALANITAQTFVIAGAKDVIKESETLKIAGAIPISILRIVPEATHSSYVKDNQQFYHYIGAFLAPTGTLDE
ncbi:alpha/beta fold hydrolase [Lacticaseibacillus nasuensis]|uniref:alpha/beta fold hydrolase n=1 Tax=Lacticaseibacillus nasuensis TaxID=944671 RepID=UPI0022468F87|nr:alpha/beta fold hydrolase [Lacticaseibacillus nasuensis]MCX2456419.1 alpha/beta fold hydrolase [Lacticaseibacillus nasuensis]